MTDTADNSMPCDALGSFADPGMMTSMTPPLPPSSTIEGNARFSNGLHVQPSMPTHQKQYPKGSIKPESGKRHSK